jgi:hypothetical protein
MLVYIQFPLSLSSSLVIGLLPAAAPPQDWYVDAGYVLCPGGIGTAARPFCRIMDAVATAADGDTIHVAPGTYLENVVLDKDLVLIGTGGEEVTIVDGMASGSVVRVNGSPVVTLTGLTLTNGSGTVFPYNTLGGGLLAADVGAHPTITLAHCSVTQNAADRGAGLFVYSYSYAFPGTGLTLLDTTVASNTGTTVGGIHSYGGLRIESSAILGNTATGTYSAVAGIQALGGPQTITNSTIAGNAAHAFVQYGGLDYGDAHGGIASQGDLTITNTTLSSNSAYGAALASGGITASDLVLANSIVFENGAATSATGTAIESILMRRICGCSLRGCCPPTTSQVSHSLVQGGWSGLGNLDADPLFVQPASSDYRLLPGSPCIDAGDSLAVPPHIWTDLAGKRRFIDDPLTPDTGQPHQLWPVVDMGAHEFGLEPPRKVRQR